MMKDKILQRRLSGLKGVFICLALIWYGLLPVRLAAADEDGILIINSDLAIEKYALVQEEFKKSITLPTFELNLGADSEAAARVNIKSAIMQRNPAVLYCVGVKAYLLATEAAPDKRIVFSSIINYQGLPLHEHVYGVSNELSAAKQLTTYQYFFPEIRTIGLLYSEVYNKEWAESAIQVGRDIGVEIVSLALERPEQVKAAVKRLLPHIQALWLITDSVVMSNEQSVQTIFTETDKQKKPVFAYDIAFSYQGAALVISADIPTVGQQAAGLALDVRADKKIAEKIQSPAGSQIILNRSTIENYGLKLNLDALDSVNQIVETKAGGRP